MSEITGYMHRSIIHIYKPIKFTSVYLRYQLFINIIGCYLVYKWQCVYIYKLINQVLIIGNSQLYAQLFADFFNKTTPYDIIAVVKYS